MQNRSKQSKTLIVDRCFARSTCRQRVFCFGLFCFTLHCLSWHPRIPANPIAQKVWTCIPPPPIPQEGISHFFKCHSLDLDWNCRCPLSSVLQDRISSLIQISLSWIWNWPSDGQSSPERGELRTHYYRHLGLLLKILESTFCWLIALRNIERTISHRLHFMPVSTHNVFRKSNNRLQKLYT